MVQKSNRLFQKCYSVFHTNSFGAEYNENELSPGRKEFSKVFMDCEIIFNVLTVHVIEKITNKPMRSMKKKKEKINIITENNFSCKSPHYVPGSVTVTSKFTRQVGYCNAVSSYYSSLKLFYIMHIRFPSIKLATRHMWPSTRLY